jgi:hypothetical protein
MSLFKHSKRACKQTGKINLAYMHKDALEVLNSIVPLMPKNY